MLIPKTKKNQILAQVTNVLHYKTEYALFFPPYVDQPIKQIPKESPKFDSYTQGDCFVQAR